MSEFAPAERVTQNRVIDIFKDELDYDYLGDWADRDEIYGLQATIASDFGGTGGTGNSDGKTDKDDCKVLRDRIGKKAADGFAHYQCPGCGADYVVPLGCCS